MAEPPLPHQNHSRRIGLRLAILIVAFSSVVTLLITALQLYSDYHQQLDDMERQLEETQVLLPSFAASVWTFNEKQIRLGLRALVNLPNMESATITLVSGDGRWTEANTHSFSVITRTYPLFYNGRGTDQQLGSLTVSVSLESVYRRLLSRAVSMLVSNGIKTFLVAAFMLFIFRRLVTARLEALESRIDSLIPQLNLLSGTAITQNPQWERQRGGDEIDRLENGFQHMTAQLTQAVTQLQTAEDDLRKSNAALDLRVKQRTAELEAANLSLTQATKVAETAAETERQIRQEQQNFLAMVSHEFRLPLSIIGASTQLLDLVVKPDHISQEELAKIHRAIGRMSSLIDVCLADERFEAGNMSPRLENVEIGALVADLGKEMAPHSPERIVITLPTTPVTIKADQSLLRIALSNLIDNGLKFSPTSRPVEIQVGSQGSEAVIRVIDRGMGIGAEDQSRIFEKYFRAASVKGMHGTGLGLHIVRRIIDLHGGAIHMASQPGTGTTFSVHLPREASSA